MTYLQYVVLAVLDHNYNHFHPLLFTVKHSGNITMAQVIEIAKTMRERSMARHLSGTVKEVLGTCQSVGCTVEGEPPHDIIDKINDGEIEIEVCSRFLVVFYF